MEELRLRVATHNICHMGKNPVDRTELFPDGSYRNGYEAGMTETMLRYWTSVYGSFSADLIGAQEYYPYFDLAHTEQTDACVFRPLGYEVLFGGHGLALFTKHPLTPEQEADFGTISARRWQKYTAQIGGLRLAVFNTHPMPKAERSAVRAAEYAFLIEEFRKEPYFLAFGDFNAHDAGEFEPFRAAGFHLANPGFSTTEVGAPCDNIISSPNILLENTALYDADLRLSDHMVLASDAVIPLSTMCK